MKSEITEKHVNNFLFRLYFDLSKGYENAAIIRAYRDFNRTLKNFPKNETEKSLLKNKWNAILTIKIQEIKSIQFANAEDFTKWHQKSCIELQTANKEYLLTQGQTQKWINMTLKYLSVMGDNYVPGISKNYEYFHIPIDTIIMRKFEKLGIKKFENVWSQISDYKTYYEYQLAVRNLFKKRIPLDVEFELFNQLS